MEPIHGLAFLGDGDRTGADGTLDEEEADRLFRIAVEDRTKDGRVFDMLKFSVMKALSVIMTKKRREALPKTFFDFRQEREARDRARTGHLLVIGAVFLILAALALVMYSRFEPLI